MSSDAFKFDVPGRKSRDGDGCDARTQAAAPTEGDARARSGPQIGGKQPRLRAERMGEFRGRKRAPAATRFPIMLPESKLDFAPEIRA